MHPDKAAFANILSESIDYAVIEKFPASIFAIAMGPLATGWNDLGAQDAV